MKMTKNEREGYLSEMRSFVFSEIEKTIHSPGRRFLMKIKLPEKSGIAFPLALVVSNQKKMEIEFKNGILGLFSEAELDLGLCNFSYQVVNGKWKFDNSI